jgi:copper chaperone CopZ
MPEIDAMTSATIRAVGKEPDGSGHTTIKIEGLKDRASVDRVAQAIFDVPGIVAVKVFLDEAKAMYDVETTVTPEAVAQAVETAGARVVG